MSYYDANAVANHILKIAKQHNERITNMKLQKLAYYAHGHYLAETGEPLLNETVQAWSYGPVIESIYYTFREFGSRPIRARAFGNDGSVARLPLDEEGKRARHLIERVWNKYGGYTASDLMQKTHSSGTPWEKLVRSQNGRLRYFQDLDDEEIRNYFLNNPLE